MPDSTVESLTQAVEELAVAVTALRSDLARRTRRLWLVVAAVMLVGAVALTYVVVGLSVTVADQANQQRAGCSFWRDIGGFDPAALQSEFGRTLVADAAVAADGLRCP